MPAYSVLDQFKLDGKTALIIGGNRGLGLAMAQALAEAGASIAIAARDEKTNKDAEQAIRTVYKVDCRSYVCDVKNEADIVAAVKNTAAHFGKIDRKPFYG
jgi:NAD(P)-dependent dehydrogenase (short-subunit alcohol dehydrogenase family)